jgi:hypothetical protein
MDNILDQAKQITEQDRNRYYGHPLDNHTCTAALWSSYINRKFGTKLELSAKDVCMLMILLKVSREANKENIDNIVDICGYARNLQMVNEEATKRANENNTRDNPGNLLDVYKS